MPRDNNQLGNRRQQQQQRQRQQAAARRRAALHADRLPPAVQTILGNGVARDATGVDYGDSKTVRWTLVNDTVANRRHALWSSLGNNDANIDAMLADLRQERGGAAPTTLRLTIQPGANDSFAAIARVVAGIEQHNQAAAANQKIEIASDDAIVRALRDGWITADNLNNLANALGVGPTRDAIADALDTVHPSRIQTMVENLAGGNPQPLGGGTVMVMGDAARAWGRIQLAADNLLTPENDQDTSLDPPAGAFAIARDAAWLRDQVHTLLRDLNPANATTLNGILEDVAQYARGLRGPLLRRLGSNYTDSVGVRTVLERLPLDRTGLPTRMDLLRGADVLGQLRGVDTSISLQTLARQGSELVGQTIAVPDRTTADYQRILAALRQAHTAAQGSLDEGGLFELADILDTARREGQNARIVTLDWDTMRMLEGINPQTDPIDTNAAPTTVDLNFAGVGVELRKIPTPVNDFPPSTQVGDLARSLGRNQNLGFGQAVRITKPDGSLVDGYLYGYTSEGLGRVLLRDQGGGAPDTLYTLDASETLAVTNDFASLTEADVRPLAAQDWQSRTVAFADLDNGPRPADPVLRMIYDTRAAMRALKTRPVADSTLTADQFTDVIKGANFKSWIVGGATRDILRGLNPADIDFASTMPAIDSFNAIVEQGLARKNADPNNPNDLAIRRNVPFGTVQVEADIETGLDIISTHDGHDASLRLDLDALARDFTINAVYYDIDGDALVDPTGTGLADLASSTLRFVAGTADEVLGAEPVMVARWMRMISKGFNPADAADVGVALKWLVEHSQTADPRVLKRFVDRMKTSKVDAIKLAEQIFGNLPPTDAIPNPRQAARDAIERIFG